MKSFLIATTLAATAQGAQADQLDNAIDAGNRMLATMQTCIDYLKTHSDAKAPECNSSKQVDAYLTAKSTVRNASPALEAIDTRKMILTGQAMQLIMKKK